MFDVEGIYVKANPLSIRKKLAGLNHGTEFIPHLAYLNHFIHFQTSQMTCVCVIQR